MTNPNKKNGNGNATAEQDKEELEALLMKASDDARSKVRSNVDFIENAKVKDWFAYGNDRNTGDLIQTVEVFVNEETEARKYVIKGTDAIVICFGKPKLEGNRVVYSNVTYNENGVPETCKVPDIEPNAEDGARWFSLQKL